MLAGCPRPPGVTNIARVEQPPVTGNRVLLNPPPIPPAMVGPELLATSGGELQVEQACTTHVRVSGIGLLSSFICRSVQGRHTWLLCESHRNAESHKHAESSAEHSVSDPHFVVASIRPQIPPRKHPLLCFRPSPQGPVLLTEIRSFFSQITAQSSVAWEQLSGSSISI